MITLLTAALVMGAIGSMHCIGMCGPIALALPLSEENNFSRFTGALLYNLGRAFTYAVIGMLLGLVGQSINLFGFQQVFSISLGVLILLFVLIAGKKDWLQQSRFLAPFFRSVRKNIASLFNKRGLGSMFGIGMLNGLLPCGLVYLAAAGAITTGDAYKSALFMAAFGLGTLPMMWAVAFFGSFINLRTRRIFNSAYPYVMAIMACLLILRGLGLDIPYISPAIHPTNHGMAVQCH